VGFDIERIRTLPQGLSDHLPILVTARMTHPAAHADDDESGFSAAS
jgi:hypothetical protein